MLQSYAIARSLINCFWSSLKRHPIMTIYGNLENVVVIYSSFQSELIFSQEIINVFELHQYIKKTHAYSVNLTFSFSLNRLFFSNY